MNNLKNVSLAIPIPASYVDGYIHRTKLAKNYVSVTGKAVDPIPHRSAVIFPPGSGSGSRRKKFRMIYSGSGSSFEFSEIRIQAKVPDPCGSGSATLEKFVKKIEKMQGNW